MHWRNRRRVRRRTSGRLHLNYFRDFDPATGRYVESDPLGLGGGSYSTYVYAGGNPLTHIDPLGLDIAVVVGGQRTDSYNIAGHIADAVTGSGIYSFGTGTPPGSPLTDYLTLQSEFRNQVVYDIKTTPAQDAAALAYLRSQKDDIGKLDNCAFRTYQSLRNAHVPIREPVAPTPAALQHVLNVLVQQGLATATYIPINGQIPDLGGFNPR
jgi:RHS repeat-associated protein